MPTVKCSLHPTENAVVFCKTCDTHQAACPICISENGKHSNHTFTSFDVGLKVVVDRQSQLIETMQLKQQGAKAYHSKQQDFNKGLLQSVVQSVSTLDKSISKLVDDLQQMRVDLHTATLQAAQTARHKANTVNLNKLAKTVRKSTLLIREARKTLDNASVETLSELVDQTPKLLEQCTGLEMALEVEALDLETFKLDTTFNEQFNDKLKRLSQQAASLKSLKPIVPNRALHINLLILAGGDGNSSMAYDPSSDTWKEVAPLSTARAYTAATLWNGKMVVAGGSNLNTVEQYDADTNSWTALPPMLLARQYFALACFDDTLFAIGGYGGNTYLCSVERYNCDTKQWQLVASLNVKRGWVCCAVPSVGILAVGGSTGQILNTCELFDSATQKWKLVGQLATARYVAAAATLNDRVYVFGGSDGSKYLDSIEEYDCVASKWTLLPVRLSVARYCLAAATVNGRIYVCGGNPNGTIVELFDCGASEKRVSCVKALPKAFRGAAAACVPVQDCVYRQLF